VSLNQTKVQTEIADIHLRGSSRPSVFTLTDSAQDTETVAPSAEATQRNLSPEDVTVFKEFLDLLASWEESCNEEDSR